LTQSVIRIILVSLHLPVTVLGNRVTFDSFLPILPCGWHSYTHLLCRYLNIFVIVLKY